MSLIDEEGERTADAQGLEPSESIEIAMGPLLEFLTARPELLLRIIACLSGYIKRKDATMSEVAFLDIAGRVVTKLGQLADRKGRPTLEGISTDVPLNQRTRAATAAAARKHSNH